MGRGFKLPPIPHSSGGRGQRQVKQEMAAVYSDIALRMRQEQDIKGDAENRYKITLKGLQRRGDREMAIIDKGLKWEQARLQRVVAVAPVSSYEIDQLHQRRMRVTRKELCMHLTNCYMRQQEVNNARWREEIQEGRLDTKPVKNADHQLFFEQTFGPTYSELTPEDLDRYEYRSERDVYRTRRSREVPSCNTSYRKQIANAFSEHGALNMSAWLPTISLYTPKEEEIKNAMNSYFEL